MLWKLSSLLLLSSAFVYFLYGVRHLYVRVEQNVCRMTYMFENPQFSRVHFEANKVFPYYRLFYYNEGPVPVNVNKLVLKGAPVIFIHGNAGSYKQVRSLASVALRKSLDSDRNIRLDYFTVDFAEELSGLYGGYLLDQDKYLKACIEAVAQLYQRSIGLPKQIFLIGHSMGGKLAQTILQMSELVPYINGILYISAPIDEPVIYADSLMHRYYLETEEFIASRRVDRGPSNVTNVCNRQMTGPDSTIETSGSRRDSDAKDNKHDIERILMISIGGGNRDLLVQAALTTSRYNDLHAMTSSIPFVWLSCDHLSILWCLQLMLVINRFLFSISKVDRNQNVYFLDDKWERLKSANRYFTSSSQSAIQTPMPNTQEIHSPERYQWDMETGNLGSIISKTFQNGLNRVHYYLLPEHEQIYLEVLGSIRPNWLKVCIMMHQMDNNKIVCKKQLDLDHLIQTIPSRSIALVDWRSIVASYSQYKTSHIMLRLPPSNEKVSVNIDRFKSVERTFYIKYEDKWWLNPFHSQSQVLLDQTDENALYYLILIEDLSEPDAILRLRVEPVTCEQTKFQVVIKMCIPWARGFEEYHKISDVSIVNDVFISIPYRPPRDYNTTHNPIKVELFLNAKCRFQISYQYSVAGKSSSIVLQYYKWLPSHLVAVLLIILKNYCDDSKDEKQARRTPGRSEEASFTNEILTHSIPLTNVFQSSTLYIVIGCRLLRQILIYWNILSDDHVSLTDNDSIFTGVIVHSSAVFLGIVLVYFIWFLVIMHGNFLYKITFNFPAIVLRRESPLMPVINALPLTFGVIFISIAIATCSGIALLLASIFYLLMLSNAYKDYWEDLVWRYSIRLLKRLYANMRCYLHSSADRTIGRLFGIGGNNSINVQMLASEQSEDDDHKLDESSILEDNKGKTEGGLQQFSFHITLLLLLIVMAAVNMGLTIAWIKSKHDKRRIIKLPDPELWTSVVVLACLSLLLQLKAPKTKSKIPRWLLYVCAILCILICEKYIYYLNQIIAVVYIAITFYEILQRYTSH